MKIECITVNNPIVNNRKISLVFINNDVDEISTKFLIKRSNELGVKGNKIASKTIRNIAYHIRLLYQESYELFGKKWYELTEKDIIVIRNAMLCWNLNHNKDYSSFDYKPIINDVMNQRLDTWFDFYNFAKQLKLKMSMVLTTKRKLKGSYGNSFLNFNNYKVNTEKIYLEEWTLKVPKSPRETTKNALSKVDIDSLIRHLNNIDIVYGYLALLMVKTGLRVDAALKTKRLDFEDHFSVRVNSHNSGNKYDEVLVKRSYISKGGDKKFYKIDIDTMAEIDMKYSRSSHYNRLKKLYIARCKRLEWEYNENIQWITKNAKEVNYYDILDAFRTASFKMGKKQLPITPHWMRHTFATQLLTDYSRKENMSLSEQGLTPNPYFIQLLANRLGHVSIESTKIYIQTALELIGVRNSMPPVLTKDEFENSELIKEIIKEKAERIFGEDVFNWDDDDILEYGVNNGEIIIVD